MHFLVWKETEVLSWLVRRDWYRRGIFKSVAFQQQRVIRPMPKRELNISMLEYHYIMIGSQLRMFSSDATQHKNIVASSTSLGSVSAFEVRWPEMVHLNKTMNYNQLNQFVYFLLWLEWIGTFYSVASITYVAFKSMSFHYTANNKYMQLSQLLPTFWTATIDVENVRSWAEWIWVA